MARAEELPITEAEWDVLKALWALGPATARGVAEHLADERGWAYSTVKTMLDRMADKKLVKARQIGNVWEYTPAVDQADARKGAWQRFVGAAFGGAVAPALAFIASEGALSKKEREQLLDLLRKGERHDR